MKCAVFAVHEEHFLMAMLPSVSTGYMYGCLRVRRSCCGVYQQGSRAPQTASANERSGVTLWAACCCVAACDTANTDTWLLFDAAAQHVFESQYK
jgi:hypothetical protein